MVLRSANGTEVFNTNNYYLKTDPNGILKAGGYLKAPSVYGQNTLSNHDNGWFMTSVVEGDIATYYGGNNTIPFTGIYTTYYYTPKYDQIKMMYTPFTYVQGGPYYDSWQPLYFTTSSSATTAGQFRYRGWLASTVQPDADGYAPTLPYVDVEVANVATQTDSGYWTFGSVVKEIKDWAWYFDPQNGYPAYNRLFKETFYTSGKGGSYYYRYAKYRTWGIMTLRNPVSLSIAVTP